MRSTISDITETFFVALSFWLFMEATRAKRPLYWLLGAGAAAAMGWFTRETVGALILLFGAAVTRADVEGRGRDVIPRNTAVRVHRELVEDPPDPAGDDSGPA